MNIYLTGQQIQKLIDQYKLDIQLEWGEVVARRKNGRPLAASTVAKMLGMKTVPPSWREEGGEVRGL